MAKKWQSVNGTHAIGGGGTILDKTNSGQGGVILGHLLFQKNYKPIYQKMDIEICGHVNYIHYAQIYLNLSFFILF